MEWFKFYGGDYLSDPKIMALNALERSCWITLLSIASVSDDEGRVRFITPERLLMMAGVAPTEEGWMGAGHIFDKFVEFGMVTHESNGDVTICNWKKRQNNYLTSAERQKLYRERKKSDARVKQPFNNSNARIEENRIEENRIDTHSPPTKVGAYTDEFASFWEKYPKKTGKGAAWSSWKRAKRPVIDVLLSILYTHVNSDQWKREGGRFIPNPATWLNQRRWEDEVRNIKSNVDKF